MLHYRTKRKLGTLTDQGDNSPPGRTQVIRR
jgi:hypothetical protein